mgnify:CR=1 FL=1
MANKKVSIDLDIEDLLGLTEPKKNTLEYDLNFIIENGIEDYIKQQENERQKDGTLKQVTKYTVIDAAMQIPQVITSTVEVMEKLADFDASFKTIKNYTSRIL